LIGDHLDNWLNGGAGADLMTGGLGNDVYFADSLGDRIVENAGEGSDTVVTSLASFDLTGTNVEDVWFVSATSINVIGNSWANVLVATAGADNLAGGDGDDTLVGNEGDDVLDGGQGVDRMIGGSGNDTYLVDDSGDVATEGTAGAGGQDTVFAAVSFSLAANIETLVLTGSDVISGTGNSAANTLNGAINLSANTLTGLAGDDIYVVDAGDTVIEGTNGGTDTVVASGSYSLGANVENLTLIGPDDVNATGNGGANAIRGNDGDNVLNGAKGNDALFGGAGDDRFVFSSGLNSRTNVDRIYDFNATDDTIALSRAVFTHLGKVGDLSRSAFHIGTHAADASDRIIYDLVHQALYYDADGTGSGAAVQFAKLIGHPVITAADFVVI
jgi:Ca2+-binding RTX toxin-like protein